LNRVIREDIIRKYIWGYLGQSMKWAKPQDGLLCITLGVQRWPCCSTPYTLQHWMHALWIPLGQFQDGSHCLCVETDHRISRWNRIWQLFHLHEMRQRSTSSLGALSIVRYEGGFSIFSRNLRTLYPLYSTSQIEMLSTIHEGSL
jgi:hypothetical protein